MKKKKTQFEYHHHNHNHNQGESKRLNRVVCSNCQKKGHYQKHCKEPIQSFGIIAVKVGNPNRFLLIRRRNSIGYETFLRGRYQNERHLQLLIDRMTTNERHRIANRSFDELWKDLCVVKSSKFYKYGKAKAKEKFEKLDIESLFKSSISQWEEPAWGIPKGRRYPNESEVQCAVREFKEETGLMKKHFKVLLTKPFVESYTGTNDVEYRQVYFIALVSKQAPEPAVDPDNHHQAAEVGAIGWYTYEEAIAMFKPYNVEKKEVLRKVNDFLSNYI